MKITVEVVNYGPGGDGPFRAGMALVKFDGKLIAKLRTKEAIEINIGKPEITTHKPKITTQTITTTQTAHHD